MTPPTLPDAPEEPGTHLTWFEGHVARFAFEPKSGALQLVVNVADVHKYQAMPITDIRGRRFNFQVFNPPDAKPVDPAGRAGVERAKQRVADRARDREWAIVKKTEFGQ